ncbi:MAG: DUF2062 domain-containing protein [Pikeienuella sp.]
MFKRRDKRPVAEIVRAYVAPRTGWRRVIHYWRHRMQRLPDSPTRIALGFACGVYASFTPFFGFHFLIAAGLAWIIRGNIFASAIGTFFGNPLTFPFIAAASLEMGSLVMNVPIYTDFSGLGFREMTMLLLHNIKSLVLPYFIGGIVPGLISSVACYLLIKPIVETYQRRRRKKLIKRAALRKKAEAAE